LAIALHSLVVKVATSVSQNHDVNMTGHRAAMCFDAQAMCYTAEDGTCNDGKGPGPIPTHYMTNQAVPQHAIIQGVKAAKAFVSPEPLVESQCLLARCELI
jgi:hypothetical protein